MAATRKKKPKNGAVPTADDLDTALAAFEQAAADFRDAVAGGDPDAINLARLALMIATANYIRVANGG